MNNIAVALFIRASINHRGQSWTTRSIAFSISGFCYYYCYYPLYSENNRISKTSEHEMHNPGNISERCTFYQLKAYFKRSAT